MSATRFECPPYKLFEPDFHPQRPVIVGVDTGLESPETATLKYEEAAARASNGGDLRGDSPPGLLPMSYGKSQQAQLHGFDSARGYQDASYQQYATQSYASQPTDSATSVGQESYAANTPVSQYIPTGPVAFSVQPSTGLAGSKVLIKISCAYDLLSVTQPTPYFYVAFGSQKCQAEILRDSQDGSGFTYTVTAEAPHLSITGSQTLSVPLSLVIDDPSGHELSRSAAGHFVYHDAPVVGAAANSDISRRKSRSAGQEEQQHNGSPTKAHATTQLGPEAPTNTFNYPVAAADASQQQAFATNFTPTGENMITTYSRSQSFTETFPRPPPALRSPAGAAWTSYAASLGPTRSPAITHTSITRPNLTPLPATPISAPQLIRTSTLQSPGSNGASSYNPYAMYPNKAILKIVGKLETMAEHWTQEEWDNRRRIVMFKKTQSGSTITTTFRAVGVNERPPNSICISCIWWAEKNECFVTSVDTIYLLEQLVAAPSRFTVEEKNRIRRNLEGFRPLTVSKAKQESEEFFKIIMAFPNPKPRNIEKDVKVFPWKILEPALKKIIGKYSASPSSTIPASHMLTPVSTYPSLPTPPVGPVSSDAYHALPAMHDTIASPRSLAGASSMYSAYAAPASRTLSPSHRTSSPLPSGLRAAPLPPVTTYDTRAMGTTSYSSGLHPSLSHPPTTSSGRWEATTVPTTYSEPYASLSAHQPSSHSLYGGGSYGEGTPRV